MPKRVTNSPDVVEDSEEERNKPEGAEASGAEDGEEEEYEIEQILNHQVGYFNAVRRVFRVCYVG